MKFIKIRTLTKKQKEEIVLLWNKEYSEKLNYEKPSEFDDYLNKQEEKNHILLTNQEGAVQAWYFDFLREEERWFAMILDSKLHGKGIGSALLTEAKEGMSELNGWAVDHNNDKKANGERYKSPIGFYKKNGFEILSETRLELDNISAVKIKWTR